jgi:hypothetical protein
MTDQRGGVVIKTGKIGRVNVLRQQIIAPGERIDTRITGRCMLEDLRERETLRINAHIATFITPIRWLDTNWVNYVKEGPDTATSLTTETTNNLGKFGIGSQAAAGTVTFPSFFKKAALRVYNEWYKWPEDADVTTWNEDGEIAVPLQHTWSRARYDATPDDTGDYTVGSATNFDVRDLANIQARFRSAMERDVLSYNRYIEIHKEMFDADGTREADQVPIMVDQQSLSVNPRELPAQDAAGLGEWSSIYDFNIDHSIRGISAPEHCVLTYVLVNRFTPIIESRNPHANGHFDWATMVCDPEILRNSKPVDVQLRDVSTDAATTSLGYLHAGWQWRSQWDVVGKRIDLANSFPMMDTPTSQANAKDATRIKDAFRSSSLGDYTVDLEFTERSRNMLGSSLESYFSGMTGAGSDATFPKQGKML